MNYFKLGLVPVLTTLLLVGCGGEDHEVDAKKAASEALNNVCSKTNSKQDCIKDINNLTKKSTEVGDINDTSSASPRLIKAIHQGELECKTDSSSKPTLCDVAAYNILNDPTHSSGKGVLTLDQNVNMSLWSSEGSSDADYSYILNMTANHSKNDKAATLYDINLTRKQLPNDKYASFSMKLNKNIDKADFVVLDMFNQFGLIDSLFVSSESNNLKDKIEVDNSSSGNTAITSKLILSAGHRFITADDSNTLIEVAKYKFAFYPDANDLNEKADGVVLGDVELRQGVGIVRIQFSVKNSQFYKFKSHEKQGEKYNLYAESNIKSLSW